MVIIMVNGSWLLLWLMVNGSTNYEFIQLIPMPINPNGLEWTIDHAFGQIMTTSLRPNPGIMALFQVSELW